MKAEITNSRFIHPSSFILHPSPLIPHPSSLIPHPSSFKTLAALIFTALLSACAGKDVKPERIPEPAPRIETRPAPEPAPEPIVSSPAPEPEPEQPGGYYQDDGPPETAPPNLSQVPDAEPKTEPLHPYANRPYAVLGKSYTPDAQRQPYRERGKASWYGKKFHGNRTSSGEVYDMYAMTAAHKTLAIPSYVRVTHVESGESVVVRVNDRGPFHSDRIIDLSYTAAHKLGMVNSGTSLVEVEAVDPELSEILSARDEKNPKRVYLQLGAFNGRKQAESYLARAKSQLRPVTQAMEIFVKDGLFRVHAGPYKDKRHANSEAAKIARLLNLKPVMIVR